MKEQLNINQYRKKKSKKKWRHRIVLIVIIVLLIALGLLVWKMMKNGIDAGQDTSGFPVQLSGDTIEQSMEMGSHVAMLTDKELNFYSGKGEKVRSITHSGSNPVICVSPEKTLLYDARGTLFSVESTTGTVFTKSADHKILLGAIASNGNSAIVTQDERSVCWMTIYNNRGDEIYKWKSSSDAIISLDFTGGGSGCLVATMGAKAGITTTVVYGLNFSQTTEQFHTEISGAMPIMIHSAGGFVHMVCDNQLVILDDKGSRQKTVEFSKKVKQTIAASDQYTVLLFGEEVRSNSLIAVYDKNGNVVGQTNSNEYVKRIASDGNRVLLLTDSKVLCCNMAMNQTACFENKQGATDIICAGSAGYDVNSILLNKFALS